MQYLETSKSETFWFCGFHRGAIIIIIIKVTICHTVISGNYAILLIDRLNRSSLYLTMSIKQPTASDIGWPFCCFYYGWMGIKMYGFCSESPPKSVVGRSVVELTTYVPNEKRAFVQVFVGCCFGQVSYLCQNVINISGIHLLRESIVFIQILQGPCVACGTSLESANRFAKPFT